MEFLWKTYITSATNSFFKAEYFYASFFMQAWREFLDSQCLVVFCLDKNCFRFFVSSSDTRRPQTRVELILSYSHLYCQQEKLCTTHCARCQHCSFLHKGTPSVRVPKWQPRALKSRTLMVTQLPSRQTPRLRLLDVIPAG